MVHALKFAYHGVYDGRATSPRDVFPRWKNTGQTELTLPRSANFVRHVARQPRRKFDQPGGRVRSGVELFSNEATLSLVTPEAPLLIHFPIQATA